MHCGGVGGGGGVGRRRRRATGGFVVIVVVGPERGRERGGGGGGGDVGGIERLRLESAFVVARFHMRPFALVSRGEKLTLKVRSACECTASQRSGGLCFLPE